MVETAHFQQFTNKFNLNIKDKYDENKSNDVRVVNAKERLWELKFYCEQDDSCNGWTVFQYYELVCLIKNVTQYYDFIKEEWFVQYYRFLFEQLLEDLERNIKIFARYESNVINDAHIKFVYINAILPLRNMYASIINNEKNKNVI